MSENNIIEINTFSKKSLEEQFNETINSLGCRSPVNMVKAISAINAMYLGRTAVNNDDFTIEEKTEIIDFVNNLVISLSDEEIDAIEENWPDNPLIFRMSFTFQDEIIFSYYNNLDKNTRSYLKKYVKKIISVLRYSDIEISSANSILINNVHFNKTEDADETEYNRHALLNLFAMNYCEGGGMVFRIDIANLIFGLAFTDNSIIEISAEDMREAECTAPDGSTLPQEPGVQYISFSTMCAMLDKWFVKNN